ncbi:MAG: bifunctional 3,4-dihydroxy-2-butanone-4-phosphate synthase/GTP cyclohydrolase II, partial [Acidobacteriota bacterium]|nr:bifunctional 3,4-dihydroxy-2-butanone-4-phosphate synthase/GTP cyclohydrolase II [Acidobacteriota bacterium]
NERLGLAVDLRNYEQCAEILRDLGLWRIRLMSNNPDKIRALEDNGLEVVERVPLHIKFHRNLARYLKTKREQMGHLINLPEEFRELPKKCGNYAV